MEKKGETRRILFRGRSAASGGWLYGDLIHNRGRVYIADDNAAASDIRGHAVYEAVPETVGRYIGIDDRNGNPIFEGDAVLFAPNSKVKTPQRFIVAPSRMYGVCMSLRLRPLRFPDGSFLKPINEYCVWGIDRSEIVGNVHDNPELQQAAGEEPTAADAARWAELAAGAEKE